MYQPTCDRREVPPGPPPSLLGGAEAPPIDHRDGNPSAALPDPTAGPLVDGADAAESDRAATSGPHFTEESVRFLHELPARRLDAEWHERNRERFERALRDPTAALLESVRTHYIHPLSPEVASGRRQLFALTKTGYGKGRYHDHFGFAFYDPAATSKAHSAQLYFRLTGGLAHWEYGFTTTPGCCAYLDRLRQAAAEAPDAVAAHFKAAPEGTFVYRVSNDHLRQWTPDEWCELLRGSASLALGSAALNVSEFAVRRVLPLDELPARGPTLADEVGRFLAWAWPMFEASRTGRWPRDAQADADDAARRREAWAVEVDEGACRTLDEIVERTSLTIDVLRSVEEALLTRHQIVLTGPPGTSKTYVAGQFARYFARQRPGQPQGATHTLYMHTSWSYEDFFEGLRPSQQNGRLVFENKPGLFLRWVDEELRTQHPRARHVLVLDELNRCDTAAVLGELLQLLEYRGVTVPLLSGRPFVFPPNLYVIGTMNSADRSVGRMDLALRRRFFWIDLLPQPDVLARWLARAGRNPANFDASALSRCNQLLAEHGVPPEQQIGHALFMGHSVADESSNGEGRATDQPLTAQRLRQVVQFGVLPYVRELLVARTGEADERVLREVEATLLDSH